jgi:prepilin-type N-terminal cleavage/methylation domain-containing protein
MRVSQKGFTLIELLVVITIIGILAAIALPNYIKAKDKAKEVEGKANLHTIQIAVERYNTDHHEYPPYLLGGDIDGWLYWHSQNDEASPPSGDGVANNWVQDPLVEYDYMTSYPENPFVDAGDGNLIIDATNCGIDSDPQQGQGDPRFGYKGNVMANGLDDPNFFEDAHQNLPYSRIETKRTLDREGSPNGAADPTAYGFPSKNSAQGDYPGLYYNFGGRYNKENGSTIFTFWPGNFFYRSSTDIQPARKGWSVPYPNTNYQGTILRYMLGVYGAQSNPGKDIIRLQEVTPNDDQEQIYWRLQPPWPGLDDYPCGYTGRINEPLGLPACFGGGNATMGPFWPPDRDPKSLMQFIYGAPDGVRDGIIHVLTAGAEKQSFDES